MALVAFGIAMLIVTAVAAVAGGGNVLVGAVRIVAMACLTFFALIVAARFMGVHH